MKDKYGLPIITTKRHFYDGKRTGDSMNVYIKIQKDHASMDQLSYQDQAVYITYGGYVLVR